MASDRMMQAIDALESAINKLEEKASALPDTSAVSSPDHDRENTPLHQQEAREALESLDTLIAELKGVELKGGARG